VISSVKQLLQLLDATFRNWQRDRGIRMGAALAYYMVLSLAPTVVVILAVTGLAFGAEAAQGRLLWQIQGLVGYEGASVIQSIILSAHRSRRGFGTTALGLVALFFGATGVVTELKDALNTIWKVPDDPTVSHARNLLRLAHDRLHSFAIVIAAGLFLLTSLVVNTWLSAAGGLLRPFATPPKTLVLSLDWITSFLITMVMFALVFKGLPNVRLQWSDVAGAAVFTSVLFNIGRFLLNLYLTHAGFEDTYGAAGSLVALLVWVYYSAQALFLGAELSRAYATTCGSMAEREIT
jgi:membrane protein